MKNFTFGLFCTICCAIVGSISITSQVEKWAQEISEHLFELSNEVTRRSRLQRVYRENTYVVSEDGNKTVGEIAKDLRNMMKTKEDGVKRIVKAAEKALKEVKPLELPENEHYRYYNADNITQTEANETFLRQMEEVRQKNELRWLCGNRTENECADVEDYSTYLPRSDEFFNIMPMTYDTHFGTHVNTNYSIVKVATNVYDFDYDITNGSYWSEPLDLAFKENFNRDTTLTWQYFASPDGFMRHYPAVKWSDEDYDKTYDFRMRSWYTEAMTSPKDVIILLDRSGSMTGMRRALSRHIVNEILDTLNDNDFVNIYTFSNKTEPLVDCMNDTLVQANEENLRLLRESLSTYVIGAAGNISIAFVKAFQLLEAAKKLTEKEQTGNRGAGCNQAIMLITEGLDYDYKKQTLFKTYNWENKFYRPVRIFTYLLGVVADDAAEMEWIACSNMGYYVNISRSEEVREKVLKYLTVMSRPINFEESNLKNFTPIWSYLYVDLADRRLTNWLWKKIEGNKQRDIFLDYSKRVMMRQHYFFNDRMTKHVLLESTHKYEKYNYLIPLPFNYTTTVSMPVIDRRINKTALLGVAAIDVPIPLIMSHIPYHKLGVNAYAFILTNNGYILMHPNLRPEFENILKPTFNRVDMTEVELLDDNSEPRNFSQPIVELRRNIVLQIEGITALDITEHIDDMRRILHYTRHYFYKSISPFSLVVALPKNYGFNMINFTNFDRRPAKHAFHSKYWEVHPEWPYCNYQCNNRREYIMWCLNNVYNTASKKESFNLLNNLVADAILTNWFNEKIERSDLLEKYNVSSIFLSTHSGLTRWQLNRTFSETKSIEESWYKRAVEENQRDDKTYIYSVPFEIIGYQYNTMVTVVSAVFSVTRGKIAPAAVTGYKFNQTALYDLVFKNRALNGSIKCGSINMTCFILDNNAYVVISDEEEYFGNLYTGNYIGDIRPDIMYHLIQDGVYKKTRTYDYQATCYYDPKEEKSSGTRFITIWKQLTEIFYWAISVLFNFFEIITCKKTEKYQSIEDETLTYEKLAIRKTVPTPCDKEMWLFTFGENINTEQHYGDFSCTWQYIVKHIENSNLLFLAINARCPIDTLRVSKEGTLPQEIHYGNTSLPCYIATHNTYNRKPYMNCIKNHTKEYKLNENRTFCGGEGVMKLY